MNNPPGRGRRPGPSHTRERIIEVARQRFLDDGYEAVTMRSIAADAAVDPALISYFFGSKRGLFGAVLALTANPAQVLIEALPGPIATLPERLLRALVTTWDDPALSAALRAMVSGAVRDPQLARLLREMAEQEMIGRIAERLGGTDATHRAAILGTQLTGIIFSRYLLAIEPLASMPADELVHRMAPALRAALQTPAPSPPARSEHDEI